MSGEVFGAFNISKLDSLKACASIYNSSIMKRLFDKSKSLKFWFLLITSANFSATSEDNLLFDMWHMRIYGLFSIPSATLNPP